MTPITSSQLRRLVSSLREASDQHRDELLTGLLVRAYPTETTQHN
jgi:hypothetical protein